MERTKRKVASKKTRTDISASHFVGYVEDEESVEAIMKKFEELERFKQELQVQTSAHEEPEENTASPTRQYELANSLNETQLEELFKRTSGYTVKEAMMDNIDLWEQQEYIDEPDCEEDYYGEVNDEFWTTLEGHDEDEEDELFGGKGKRRGRSLKLTDKEAILNRYKVMQVQLQDRNGNLFTVRRKVRYVDPSVATYVKLPSLPISRSWAHTIVCYRDVQKCLPGSKYVEDDILSMNLKSLGTQYIAILMDPPLLLPGEESVEQNNGKLSLMQFASLKIPDIIPFGFIFIWLEKELIQDMLKIMERWGFMYIENFCWIKKNVRNEIVRQNYRYFNKSKLSLLIFRKEGAVELRHQRNPDCVFDFIKPKSEELLTEEKPEFVYDVIETLLPGTSISSCPKGGKLIELWAKKESYRTAWTKVVQKH